MNTKALVIVILAVVLMSTSSRSQNSTKTDDATLNAYVDDLREDLKADKVALINEAMQFSERDAAAFWPVYKQYEREQAKLNDERLKLVKNYTSKWTALTDVEAKGLAKMALDLESRRADLRSRYFGEFNKVLPGLTVAKFFQLEHRLDLLVDLKIASELPALLVRPSETSTGGNGKVPK